MQNAIISDTSCIILLHRIEELSILQKIFGTVIVTQQVAVEFGYPLPAWFDIQQPHDTNNQLLIEQTVDKGEASAIALALEYDDALLIIDDRKGRTLAQQLGIVIIGTLGVILHAKLTGVIPSVKPILQKIKQSNFRISPQLEKLILERSGE